MVFQKKTQNIIEGRYVIVWRYNTWTLQYMLVDKLPTDMIVDDPYRFRFYTSKPATYNEELNYTSSASIGDDVTVSVFPSLDIALQSMPALVSALNIRLPLPGSLPHTCSSLSSTTQPLPNHPSSENRKIQHVLVLTAAHGSLFWVFGFYDSTDLLEILALIRILAPHSAADAEAETNAEIEKECNLLEQKSEQETMTRTPNQNIVESDPFFVSLNSLERSSSHHLPTTAGASGVLENGVVGDFNSRAITSSSTLALTSPPAPISMNSFEFSLLDDFGVTKMNDGLDADVERDIASNMRGDNGSNNDDNDSDSISTPKGKLDKPSSQVLARTPMVGYGYIPGFDASALSDHDLAEEELEEKRDHIALSKNVDTIASIPMTMSETHFNLTSGSSSASNTNSAYSVSRLSKDDKPRTRKVGKRHEETEIELDDDGFEILLDTHDTHSASFRSTNGKSTNLSKQRNMNVVSVKTIRTGTVTGELRDFDLESESTSMESVPVTCTTEDQHSRLLALASENAASTSNTIRDMSLTESKIGPGTRSRTGSYLESSWEFEEQDESQYVSNSNHGLLVHQKRSRLVKDNQNLPKDKAIGRELATIATSTGARGSDTVNLTDSGRQGLKLMEDGRSRAYSASTTLSLGHNVSTSRLSIDENYSGNSSQSSAPISLHSGSQYQQTYENSSLGTHDGRERSDSWARTLQGRAETNPLTSRKHRIFQTIFQLPSSQPLLCDMQCSISSRISTRGRLYVSPDYICFYSSLFGFKTVVMTPRYQVVSARVSVSRGTFDLAWVNNSDTTLNTSPAAIPGEKSEGNELDDGIILISTQASFGNSTVSRVPMELMPYYRFMQFTNGTMAGSGGGSGGSGIGIPTSLSDGQTGVTLVNEHNSQPQTGSITSAGSVTELVSNLLNFSTNTATSPESSTNNLHADTSKVNTSLSLQGLPGSTATSASTLASTSPPTTATVIVPLTSTVTRGPRDLGNGLDVATSAASPIPSFVYTQAEVEGRFPAFIQRHRFTGLSSEDALLLRIVLLETVPFAVVPEALRGKHQKILEELIALGEAEKAAQKAAQKAALLAVVRAEEEQATQHAKEKREREKEKKEKKEKERKEKEKEKEREKEREKEEAKERKEKEKKEKDEKITSPSTSTALSAANPTSSTSILSSVLTLSSSASASPSTSASTSTSATTSASTAVALPTSPSTVSLGLSPSSVSASTSASLSPSSSSSSILPSSPLSTSPYLAKLRSTEAVSLVETLDVDYGSLRPPFADVMTLQSDLDLQQVATDKIPLSPAAFFHTFLSDTAAYSLPIFISSRDNHSEARVSRWKEYQTLPAPHSDCVKQGWRRNGSEIGSSGGKTHPATLFDSYQALGAVKRDLHYIMPLDAPIGPDKTRMFKSQIAFVLPSPVDTPSSLVLASVCCTPDAPFGDNFYVAEVWRVSPIAGPNGAVYSLFEAYAGANVFNRPWKLRPFLGTLVGRTKLDATAMHTDLLTKYKTFLTSSPGVAVVADLTACASVIQLPPLVLTPEVLEKRLKSIEPIVATAPGEGESPGESSHVQLDATSQSTDSGGELVKPLATSTASSTVEMTNLLTHDTTLKSLNIVSSGNGSVVLTSPYGIWIFVALLVVIVLLGTLLLRVEMTNAKLDRMTQNYEVQLVKLTKLLSAQNGIVDIDLPTLE